MADSQPTGPILQQVTVSYAAGNHLRAEQLCKDLLGSQPDCFEALSLLGVMAYQQGKPEAVTWFARAAAARPHDAAAVESHGMVLMELGRTAEALASYSRLVELRPDDADAHHRRGVVQQRLQRFGEALASYERALALRPGHAEAHNNRCVLFGQLGRFAESLASADQALAIRADFAEAHNNRGLALLRLKRYAEARESHEQALRLNPRSAEAWNNRGNALQRLGAPQEALQSYERALQLMPQLAEAHSNRAGLLREAWCFEEAVRSYDRALERQPRYADALHGRGVALQALGRYDEARQSYERAFALKPDTSWLRGDWLMAKMQLCDWSGMESPLAQLQSDVWLGKPAATPFALLAVTDSPALHRQAAKVWVSEMCPPDPGQPIAPVRSRRDKIRLGYYSSDYREHPVASLAAGLFELHDRQRFEVVAFSSGPPASDPMAVRLAAAFDQFIDVRARSVRDIAQLSREMEIDIAIDLMGFTHNARTGIFAARAAPIQVNYLGYPGTLGAPYFDYLIADATLIPPGSRSNYAEQIVYLPHSFQVNDRSRPVTPRQFSREELGLPAEAVVFCCFNNTYKIGAASFACWMRILGKVPGSVLWLASTSDAARANLCRAAAARGVAPERLVFAPRLPHAADHLARQRAADMFLDTFPYNAHTTASDALWAGLPVVTRMGESYAARVAASLLRAVGLPELITESAEQYEALAVDLAHDRARRARLRELLDRDRLTMPLFDTAGFARHLEQAYRTMYERHLAGAAPESFAVPA
jgi:predicted O-linked N-acetylglucosamine transferase (SPINDLY family)